MADGQRYHKVNLPDSTSVNFPIEMSDEDVGNAVQQIMSEKQGSQEPVENGPLPEQIRTPQSPAVQWAQKTAQSIAGPQSSFGRGANDIRASLSALGRGDVPTAAMGAVNAASNAPGAALSVLNYIPEVGPALNQGLSALAKPGVDLWNQVQQQLRPATKTAFGAVGLKAPTLFSPQANEQANELGQNAMGALSATAAGATAAPILADVPGSVRSARSSVANTLTEGAFKIPPTFKPEFRDAVVNTIQKYNITPNKAGIAKMETQLGTLRDAQARLEDAAANSDVPMGNTKELLGNIDGLIDKWSKGDTPEDFVNVLREYRDKVVAQNNPRLSLGDMIDMKRNLQKQLTSVYNRAAKINPSVATNLVMEAKSAFENGLRTKLEDVIPGYGQINKQFTDLLNAKPLVDRAANRVGNYNRISIKDLLTAGMTYQFLHNPALAVGSVVAERALTHPSNWARAGNVISPAEAPNVPVPADASAAAGKQSPYAVSIANRGLPPEGAGQQGVEQGWQKHPSGFEYRHIPEGQ